MTVHKYLFWISDSKICTYDVEKTGSFTLRRYRGEDTYAGKDSRQFQEWFLRIASLTEYEAIDCCCLSDQPFENISWFEMSAIEGKAHGGGSSWSKSEIGAFCESCMQMTNYRIIFDAENSFVCQQSNLTQKDSMKNLYLKCVPAFTIQSAQDEQQLSKNAADVNDVSKMSRYYIEKLQGL